MNDKQNFSIVTDVTASDHSQKHSYEAFKERDGNKKVVFKEEEHATTWRAGYLESLLVNYLKNHSEKCFPVIVGNSGERTVEIIPRPEEKAGFLTAVFAFEGDEGKLRLIQMFIKDIDKRTLQKKVENINESTESVRVLLKKTLDEKGCPFWTFSSERLRDQLAL